MKRFFFILCSFFLYSSLEGQWGWGKDDAVEEVDNGSLNYSNGFVVATGIGAISPLAQNPGMARATAVRAAKVDALRNLLEAVLAVTVSSETTIRGAAIEDDVVKTKVEGMVKGARIRDINGDGKRDTGDIRYLSDTSIEMEMEVHMSGISEIILPPAKVSTTSPAAAATPAIASPSVASSGTVTGIIIDARGLGLRPAMSPKIFDQNGSEVYGTGTYTREYAIKYGVAGYSKDVTTASADPRVVGNPVVLKGIGVLGKNNADVVISNSDALEMNRAESAGKVLSSCKVMIVLD